MKTYKVGVASNGICILSFTEICPVVSWYMDKHDQYSFYAHYTKNA
jgi:hypothetical protein